MQAAVDDYHKLATDNALCDYSFHVIVTDPNEEQMHVELPKLIEQGITSVKVSYLRTERELKTLISSILDLLNLSCSQAQ
jgi:dihydropyrimidinase